jgi:hypothetical protein
MRKSAVLLLVLTFLTAPCTAAGKPVWVSSEMSSQNYEAPAHDIAYSLVVTSDGGFALAGSTSTPSDQPIKPTDLWLVKTDPYEVAEWNQTYGRTGYDVVYSLVAASDGGFALAGYTDPYGAEYEDFWLVKTDMYGNMEWSQTYGGAGFDSAYSLVETSDGGFALAGYTTSFGAGDADFWLVKTDANGNLERSQTYGRVMPATESTPTPEPTPEPEPIPATWIATAIVISAIVGVGLLFYFKKRRGATR